MTILPLALAVCYLGFAALAAAMPRHIRQMELRGRPSLFRLAGCAALVAALLLCCTVWNPARAIPVLIGLASAAAIAVALTLAFAPRAAAWIAALLLGMTGLVSLW